MSAKTAEKTPEKTPPERTPAMTDANTQPAPTKTGRREFDPSRWAQATFGVFFFLGVWFFLHALDEAWSLAFSYFPQVGRPSSVIVTLVAVVVALVATLWAARREAYFRFITDVVVEVSQIVWPTRAETQQATIVVISISLIAAMLMWGMDIFWATFTEWLYGL